MEMTFIILLLLQLAATTVIEQFCKPNPCGANTQCKEVDFSFAPTCMCLPGYKRSPLAGCRKHCESNTKCGPYTACIEFKCQNPCSQCGVNAECDSVQNHPFLCKCSTGYYVNPMISCQPICVQPSDCPPGMPICFANSCKNPCDKVCGVNATCELRNGTTPVCLCPKGMIGDPFRLCRPLEKGLRHECESNAECGSQMTCIEFKCQNPCSQCGVNAECDSVQNHVPLCKCPKGYYGNPMISCQPGCVQHSDCPPGMPICFANSCKNPCDGVCGVNAKCELKNGTIPECLCPKSMIGDPFVMCRPLEKEGLCKPNPCGANAICTPGYNKNNEERPVCTCYQGYLGDAVKGCIQGECVYDNQCPDHQACLEHKCQNPCRDQCGKNARCTTRRHVAVCVCHNGYIGDALTHCYLNQLLPPDFG